jgi:hypothetical protein
MAACTAIAQQTPVTGAVNLPGRYINKLEQKLSLVENGLNRKADILLQKALKREAKMKRKLQRTNAELARRLFSVSLDSLQHLKQPVPGMAAAGEYIPWLDSAQTALNFLQTNPLDRNITNKEVTGALAKVNDLKASLANTEKVKQYLKERKEVLTQHLGKLPGYGKQLKKLNESIYYYQQSVAEWKSILSDRKKLEQKAIALLNKSKAFQNFMARNSELARLFPGALSTGSGGTGSALAGLQTRAQVSGLLQQQLQAGGPNAQAALQAQVSNAMAQLNKLKSGDYSNSGGTAADLPNFQPKPLKHKRLLSRLEPGFSLQVNKNNRFFPTIADMGAQLRYAAGKGSGIGVGASYKMGLGTGWKDIRVSFSGLSVRSFADYRMKGSIWFNAGFEMNYLTGLTSPLPSAGRPGPLERGMWNKSALAGICKKFNVGKKMKGSMLLLYDFLHKNHLPNTQAFVYRVTYSFK